MPTQRTFEGRALEPLLDHVKDACGPDAVIVSADRVRRGGIGGFFAHEVFELVVEEPDEAPVAAATTAPAATTTAPDGDVITRATSEADAVTTDDDTDGRAEADADAAAVAEMLDPAAREQRFAAALADALDDMTDWHEGDGLAPAAPVAAPAPAPAPAPVPAGVGAREPMPAAVAAVAAAVSAPIAVVAPLAGVTVAPEPTPTPTPDAPRMLDDTAHGAPGIEARALHPAGTARIAEAPAFTSTIGAVSATTASPMGPRPAAPVRPVDARLPVVAAPLGAPRGPILEDRPPMPTLWELLGRYEALPALPESLPHGVTVVLGRPGEVLTAAEGVAARAGLDPAQVVVVTRRWAPELAVWRHAGGIDAALDHVAAVAAESAPGPASVVLAVEIDDDLTWTDAVLGALAPTRRHVALAARTSLPEATALTRRLAADAVDLVGLDDAATPDELCRLGLPVTTLEGRPASPALWAALALEWSSRVPS